MEYINKICDVLKKKQENNELFSEQDICQIVKWIVAEEQLQDYVKKITFNNALDSNANYSEEDSSISINFQKSVKYDNNLNDNIILINVIFHELAHAKQLKLIESYDDNNNLDKERLILELITKKQELYKMKEFFDNNKNEISIKESLKILKKIIKLVKIYNTRKGYIAHFMERQAEYDAVTKCQLILEQIDNDEAKSLNESYKREKYQIYLLGYKAQLRNVKYPFQYLQNNIEVYDPMGSMAIYVDNCFDLLTLEERLIHGFPITKKEFKEIDFLANEQSYLSIKINQICKTKNNH